MMEFVYALRAMALEDIERFRKAKTRAAGLYALAAVLGLTAYACGVVALIIWVARQGDPLLAVAAMAVAFAALALIVLAVVALLNRAERRRRAARAEAYAATLRSATRSAVTGMMMRPQTLAAGAAVLIAGLALGILDRKGRGGPEGPPPPNDPPPKD